MADRRIDSSDQDEDPFASPSPSKPPRNRPAQPQSERSKTPTNQNTRFDTDEVREAALRRELEGVRNINHVIEGVIGTLERAKGNMGVCCQYSFLPPAIITDTKKPRPSQKPSTTPPPSSTLGPASSPKQSTANG